jgi:hypothetical protein
LNGIQKKTIFSRLKGGIYMNTNQFTELKTELANVRKEAVAAHIAGNREKAECLTGKAVGMKTTLEVVEKVIGTAADKAAVGELEGMERVIKAIGPVPKCSTAL